MSTKAYARLVNIDPSPALAMDGVLDFVSRVDVPGNNKWGTMDLDEVFADEKVPVPK